ALRHLRVLLDEDRPARLERADHVAVVNDLLADVDRRAIKLERPLDGLHRPVDAGAVTTGLGEQHTLRRGRHTAIVRAGWRPFGSVTCLTRSTPPPNPARRKVSEAPHKVSA